MGGRGSFDVRSGSISVENRMCHQIGEYNGIKILDSDHFKNGRPPVMSNTKNTAYAIWSSTAGRIKQVLFYKNHIPYKQIDIQGSLSHWHKVKVGTDGEIGRISHDSENVFKPTKSQWKLIKALSKWRKK